LASTIIDENKSEPLSTQSPTNTTTNNITNTNNCSNTKENLEPNGQVLAGVDVSLFAEEEDDNLEFSDEEEEPKNKQ